MAYYSNRHYGKEAGAFAAAATNASKHMLTTSAREWAQRRISGVGVYAVVFQQGAELVAPHLVRMV